MGALYPCLLIIVREGEKICCVPSCHRGKNRKLQGKRFELLLLLII